MRELIEQGYVYIAQPPLYRVQKGRTERYAYSDAERDLEIGKLSNGKDGRGSRFSATRGSAR